MQPFMRGTKRFRFIKIPEKILNPERITEKKERVGQKFMQNTGEKIRRRRREKYRNRVFQKTSHMRRRMLERA